MMKRMNKKAFTLIELLVVIAVVGILVLLAAPRFTGYTQKAELARIQHDTKVMEEELGTVLINGDDDFNKWESSSKNLNQLAQEGKLFEKEGVATDVEPIDGTYKVIPEEYKDKINTKLKGTFYANSDGKVYYEHGKSLFGIPTEPEEEPGYSEEEIDDLVYRHEYIPVATAEELNSIRNGEERERIYGEGTKWKNTYKGGLGKHYVQVLNIDLSEYSKEEEGWTPIGTAGEEWGYFNTSLASTSFKGTYDGGNYVITGLEVKGKDERFQGLFGFTQGATIRNVGLINNKVIGQEFVGGLVGYAISDTKISNSYATGSVEGTGTTGTYTRSYAGGLVGKADYSSSIDNSYATGSVTGTGEYAGGLVGWATGRTTISDSYATGEVIGGSYVGGLVGSAEYSSNINNSYATGLVKGSGSVIGGLVGKTYNIIIDNSYATGDVTGDSNIGGLVGTASKSFIDNSYATDPVTGVGRGVGGLIGTADDSTIEKSYFTGPVKGSLSVGGLVGEGVSATISNSYATGSVEGTPTERYVGKNVGGLVGLVTTRITINNSYAAGSLEGAESVGGLVGATYPSNANVTISNSYWDINTTGQTSSHGKEEGKSGTGLTTDEMKSLVEHDYFDNWNSETPIWEITPENYPTLR